MSTQDILDKGSVQQAEQADQAATGSSDAVDGAMSEEEKTRQCLAEERMNRTMSLPECVSLRLPRAVSYAEVGDPSGYPVCLVYLASGFCSSTVHLLRWYRFSS